MTNQEQELKEAARVALLKWLHYLDGSGIAVDHSGDLETAESWPFQDVLCHCYEMNHPHM